MTISNVQHSSVNAGTVTLGHCAFGSANAAGNLLVCVIRNGLQGVALTVTDSAGNIWTEVGDLQTGSNGVWMFYAPNCAAGANTVNVSSNGAAASMRIAVSEYQGADPTAPLDVSNTATGAGTQVSVPLTTSFNGELLVIGHMSSIASVPTGGSAQYTVEEQINNFVGLTDGYGVLAGAETGLVNLATTCNWYGVMAAFRGPVDVTSVFLVPKTEHRLHEYQYQC